jgi:hypothetical protein
MTDGQIHGIDTNTDKGKGKGVRDQAMKAYRASRGKPPLIRNFGTRWRRLVTFTLQPKPSAKEPRYPSNGRLCGPCSPTGIRTRDNPAHSLINIQTALFLWRPPCIWLQAEDDRKEAELMKCITSPYHHFLVFPVDFSKDFRHHPSIRIPAHYPSCMPNPSIPLHCIRSLHYPYTQLPSHTKSTAQSHW